MKIKKSIIDQLVKEEVAAMINDGLLSEGEIEGVEGGFLDRFKRGLVRGFSKHGEIGRFVASMAAPAEAKAAISAMNELEKALEALATSGDIKATGGYKLSPSQLARMNLSPEMQKELEGKLLNPSASIENIQRVAGAMKKELISLFSQLGSDAPDASKDAAAEEAEAVAAAGAGAGAGEEMSDEEATSADRYTENLRRQVRRKLRHFTF